ncbi:hypothetical protein CF326_g560 [Tilletia indica]|uniref:Nucleoporin NDC1 n=1 Tax=Tilletia indica TaxID=43049 RepID=A0A177TWK8_9BASI|nr:hypothetical protein CF326_g560 [Tilletia indica]KAE8250865.1 hypothetical protein A4X13_0g4310 [Tilletia indica]
MPADLRQSAPSYSKLLRIALPGRLRRIYAFSFLALHLTFSLVLTFPLSPRSWFWIVLRPFWPQLFICSSVAFLFGLLPLLIADRRATTRFIGSGTQNSASAAAGGTNVSPKWLNLLLLRVSYAVVLGVTYAAALAWVNEATSPTYRDSWIPYLPAYYGRAPGSSGTVTTSSRKHGGSASHAAHLHTQSRPNERVIFLVTSAVLTSVLVPFIFARTSAQGVARRPGDATALLFHPAELHASLTDRLRSSVLPRLQSTTAGAQPGKEPAQLFSVHTLTVLLLPPAIYLPIYTIIRRPLYRSLLMLIMRATTSETRSSGHTLSGARHATTLATSAAANLRYYLIPSLRGGTLSFLFNVELFLRPALLSAAIFAVAELSLSLGRVYASQPVLVSGFANAHLSGAQGAQTTPAAEKDAYTAPTRCLVEGVASLSSQALNTSTEELYALHLAIAELAILSSSTDSARRRALFNDFGDTGPASRLTAGRDLDTLGGYGASLPPGRVSAWAQVAKAGIKILQQESAAVRNRIAPPKSSSALQLTSGSGSKGSSKTSGPSFGKDAYVPFTPPSAPAGAKAAPSTVLQTPAPPKSVWDKLAEEVAASGSSSQGTAQTGTAQAGTPSALLSAAMIPSGKSSGIVPKAVGIAGSALRLLLPPPPPAASTTVQQASSTAMQKRPEAPSAPITPLDAAQTLLHAGQHSVQLALQRLDRLVPQSSRDAVLAKVKEAVPANSSAQAGDSVEAFLQLLLPVSPATLQKVAPLLKSELQAASTSATLARVLPPHPALAIWTAQALSDLAAASLSEDEYGCVQRASRASVRARSRRHEAAGQSGSSSATEAGAGVSDLVEAMLDLWESVDAALTLQREDAALPSDGATTAWEASVHEMLLLPLRRSIGELWAGFGKFGSEIGFGAGDEETMRWRSRVEAVLHSDE